MKTLYIDIYFLINFCIDVLAFYYASNMAHIKTGNIRLMTLGIIGGASAVIHILNSSAIILIANIVISILLFALIGATGVGIVRRIKFLVLFLIIQLLIGGCVSFGYGLLDRYVYPWVSDIDDSVANRGALVFAVLVLFAIFVIRLIVLLFTSSTTEKSVTLCMELEGKRYECEAFVDSGNLVRDPISLSPVVFVSAAGARRMGIPIDASLDKVEELNKDYQKRIRLIPIKFGGKTKICVGIKFDAVSLKRGDRSECVDAIIVLNKEEKTYAGYDSLIPSCLLNEIK